MLNSTGDALTVFNCFFVTFIYIYIIYIFLHMYIYMHTYIELFNSICYKNETELSKYM